MTVQFRPLAPGQIEAQRGLSRNEAKTLALASLGGALEYYDFIVGVFFAKTLAAVFFPLDSPQWLSQLQIFGIFAAGYLVRPIGGVVFAHFGDRVGRKRMFALGLFLMAFPTLLVGLTPDYKTIGLAAPLVFLFCRLLQGLSVGGEVPGAWIFCAEHVHKTRVGFACGLLMAGLCCGILMGALTAKILTSSLGADDLVAWGWRIPFILGGVFGLISVYLRKYLQETPVFEALRERRVADARLPISLVFARCKSEVLLSMAATWVFAGVFVTYFLYLPTYLQSQFDYRAADVFTANCWSITLLILGSVFVGRVTDVIGGGKAYAIGGVAMAAVVAALGFALANGSAWTLHLYAIGGFAIGTITLTPYLIIRSFPPELRFTGFALSYNTAYAIVGGTTPPLMTILVGERALAMAPFYYMSALCLLGAAIGWLRREG
ncbi:MFS transporter [Methylocystis sp. Sn-Cys]|uniref:MFS transporter n=1 Tax=Methylocystis sp. Sn-Cys TaxID=1701263 RepID=UPI0019229188|nr:MFS transporter [Methylocystis sp. Sn-Cys]MBL1257766.1 MFS transporter [Methylocystis sp. Sn-Cys]